MGNTVFMSEMYNEAVKVGSHRATEGDVAGGPQVCDRAVPSERAHEPLGGDMAPGTCYWRGVDPEDGHIFADVKNFGALQEFLVLNGLFPWHPDHRLLKVGSGDFFTLEEEQDFTLAW